jgi:hypothetical protein
MRQILWFFLIVSALTACCYSQSDCNLVYANWREMTPDQIDPTGGGDKVWEIIQLTGPPGIFPRFGFKRADERISGILLAETASNITSYKALIHPRENLPLNEKQALSDRYGNFILTIVSCDFLQSDKGFVLRRFPPPPKLPLPSSPPPSTTKGTGSRPAPPIVLQNPPQPLLGDEACRICRNSCADALSRCRSNACRSNGGQEDTSNACSAPTNLQGFIDAVKICDSQHGICQSGCSANRCTH